MARLNNYFYLLELGYLVVIAPLILFPRPTSSLLLLGIAGIWVLRFTIKGYFLPQTAFNVAILFLLIMILISQFVSADLTFGAPKLFSIIWSIAFFFAIIDFAQRSTRYFWLAVFCFVVAGFGLMILAVIGTDWSEKTHPAIAVTNNFPRIISGVQGAEEGWNTNEVAGTLLLFLPMTWAVAIASLWHYIAHRNLLSWRYIAGLSLLLFAFAQLALLFVLESRSALIGLTFAILIVSFFAGKTGRVLGLSLAALLAVGWYFVDQYGFSNILELLLARRVATMDNRMVNWTRGLAIIELFPVTGLGLNMYRISPHLFPAQFMARPREILSHVHNMYLQVAVDLGLPALIAYLAILILAFAMLALSWKKTNAKTLKIMVAGCAIALLSHTLFGLLDAVVLGAKPGVVFWCLLALISSLFALSNSVSTQDSLK